MTPLVEGLMFLMRVVMLDHFPGDYLGGAEVEKQKVWEDENGSSVTYMP